MRSSPKGAARPDPRDVIRFEPGSRMPVLWMARLVNALSDSDRALERRALYELCKSGFFVIIDPRKRKPLPGEVVVRSGFEMRGPRLATTPDEARESLASALDGTKDMK